MIPWVSLMSTRQKRQRQGSSSQPSKKPLLDVQKQGSSQITKKPLPDLRKQGSHKSKGNNEKILKPNIHTGNRGENVAHSSKGMSLLFSELSSHFFFEKLATWTLRTLHVLRHLALNCLIIGPHSSYLLRPKLKLWHSLWHCCVYIHPPSWIYSLYFPCSRQS